MKKVTPFLWFNNNAEEAMKFYSFIFKNSKILKGNRMNIEGQEFIFFNGGPSFKFNESISWFINCKNQREIDYYWNSLSKGGKKSMCGWIRDKFGLWWQIVPEQLGEMLMDKNPKRANNVMNAMLKMQKLDIKKLQHAYDKE